MQSNYYHFHKWSTICNFFMIIEKWTASLLTVSIIINSLRVWHLRSSKNKCLKPCNFVFVFRMSSFLSLLNHIHFPVNIVQTKAPTCNKCCQKSSSNLLEENISPLHQPVRKYMNYIQPYGSFPSLAVSSMLSTIKII